MNTTEELDPEFIWENLHDDDYDDHSNLYDDITVNELHGKE